MSENQMSLSATHSTIHGYCRCSTCEDKQDINRQIRELKAYGAMTVWQEYEHGDADVKAQQALMLCEIMETVRDRRLCLQIVGSITLDCRTGNPDPMSEAFLQIAGVFSQLELSMIRTRVRSGMENARAKGVRLGRPPICADGIPERFLRYYPGYLSGKYNMSELARLTGYARTTCYRYARAMEAG